VNLDDASPFWSLPDVLRIWPLVRHDEDVDGGGRLIKCEAAWNVRQASIHPSSLWLASLISWTLIMLAQHPRQHHGHERLVNPSKFSSSDITSCFYFSFQLFFDTRSSKHPHPQQHRDRNAGCKTARARQKTMQSWEKNTEHPYAVTIGPSRRCFPFPW
jgi:hypothetical protein